MCAGLKDFFISLHYVINSNAKINEKNDISKYMWIYLNIINILSDNDKVLMINSLNI